MRNQMNMAFWPVFLLSLTASATVLPSNPEGQPLETYPMYLAPLGKHFTKRSDIPLDYKFKWKSGNTISEVPFDKDDLVEAIKKMPNDIGDQFGQDVHVAVSNATLSIGKTSDKVNITLEVRCKKDIRHRRDDVIRIIGHANQNFVNKTSGYGNVVYDELDILVLPTPPSQDNSTSNSTQPGSDDNPFYNPPSNSTEGDNPGSDDNPFYNPPSNSTEGDNPGSDDNPFYNPPSNSTEGDNPGSDDNPFYNPPSNSTEGDNPGSDDNPSGKTPSESTSDPTNGDDTPSWTDDYPSSSDTDKKPNGDETQPEDNPSNDTKNNGSGDGSGNDDPFRRRSFIEEDGDADKVGGDKDGDNKPEIIHRTRRSESSGNNDDVVHAACILTYTVTKEDKVTDDSEF